LWRSDCCITRLAGRMPLTHASLGCMAADVAHQRAVASSGCPSRIAGMVCIAPSVSTATRLGFLNERVAFVYIAWACVGSALLRQQFLRYGSGAIHMPSLVDGKTSACRAYIAIPTLLEHHRPWLPLTVSLLRFGSPFNMRTTSPTPYTAAPSASPRCPSRYRLLAVLPQQARCRAAALPLDIFSYVFS